MVRACHIVKVAAASIHRGNLIVINGEPVRVKTVTHLNRSPYQLYQFTVDRFEEPICVPATWEIEVVNPMLQILSNDQLYA